MVHSPQSIFYTDRYPNIAKHGGWHSGDSAVRTFYYRKQIFCQHQQFIESLAELWELLGIPSSVMAFAVSCSLILMRLQNWSINEGKVVALITVNFWSLLLNLYGLVYLVWKQVVFLANNFCTGPVFLAFSDTADLRSFCLVWTRPHEFIWNGFSCIETILYSFYLIMKCES